MLSHLFNFYGSKWRLSGHYSAPQYPIIVEPFAGSAGYSHRWHTHEVKLFDADYKIAGLWQWLIVAKPEEITALPDVVTDVSELAPKAAQWLVGFWLDAATASPRRKPAPWLSKGIEPTSYWRPLTKHLIANQLHKIRHWVATLGTYEAAPDIEATWFIDPPYQGSAGRAYSEQVPDYRRLADWCRTRKGQVIVCEQEGADWLPFRPLGRTNSADPNKGRRVKQEVIWTNDT